MQRCDARRITGSVSQTVVLSLVIPAEAGIQDFVGDAVEAWAPAFPGCTTFNLNEEHSKLPR